VKIEGCSKGDFVYYVWMKNAKFEAKFSEKKENSSVIPSRFYHVF